ncbi:hypothetical protein PM082_002294 [Marasmius tenuissimus]|nr:hypothetical protein PM082_002294 [Marasmius tenuissimus]
MCKQMNERKETDQLQSFIEHKEEARYLINLFSFHNAHLIRRILPRKLTAPTPIFKDRSASHLEIAEELHASLLEKKEETKKKRAKTALKKKRAADELLEQAQKDSSERQNKRNKVNPG